MVYGCQSCEEEKRSQRVSSSFVDKKLHLFHYSSSEEIEHQIVPDVDLEPRVERIEKAREVRIHSPNQPKAKIDLQHAISNKINWMEEAWTAKKGKVSTSEKVHDS